jgi:hypothetical protein
LARAAGRDENNVGIFTGPQFSPQLGWPDGFVTMARPARSRPSTRRLGTQAKGPFTCRSQSLILRRKKRPSPYWAAPSCSLRPFLATTGTTAGRPFYYPAFPDQPHVKIQDAGRVGQRSHNFSFDRNAVLVDFAVERLAEYDHTLMGLAGHRLVNLRWR